MRMILIFDCEYFTLSNSTCINHHAHLLTGKTYESVLALGGWPHLCAQ